MGPWETSVEKRLESLDRRLTTVEGDTGQIRIDTAVLRRDVDELPKKGFIVKTVTTGSTLVAAIVVVVQLLQHFLK